MRLSANDKARIIAIARGDPDYEKNPASWEIAVEKLNSLRKSQYPEYCWKEAITKWRSRVIKKAARLYRAQERTGVRVDHDGLKKEDIEIILAIKVVNTDGECEAEAV